MALERLVKVRPYSVRDFERPTMTEYQALLVSNYDHDLTDYFTNATMRLNPGLTRDAAESLVTVRARALAQQSGAVATNTLIGLEGLIKSAKSLPGRKLIFSSPVVSSSTIAIPTRAAGCNELPARQRAAV